jgi:acetoin utilization deacetylase AcuC-like enzyme
MELVVASNPAALHHDTGTAHPERPERVEAVLLGLRDSGLESTEILSPAIERSHLALVHEPSYIEMIERFCRMGGGALDMDTYATEATWDAALTAAGGVHALVEELGARTDRIGFAVSRPPGHHAMPTRAMGFCFFNNVAVTAAYLRSRGERVAVLDWDVHHGNGTQAILEPDPGALYVSIHQQHFYPYTGHVEDIEESDAKGTVVNIPLPAHTGGDVYRRAWVELVLPVVGQFEPDWLLLSAGFDAHVDDHLAHMRLLTDDYSWMAAELAEAHSPSRTVVVLEGGYDLDALRSAARATVRGLAGQMDDIGPPLESPPHSHTALDEAAAAIARHWAL